MYCAVHSGQHQSGAVQPCPGAKIAIDVSGHAVASTPVMNSMKLRLFQPATPWLEAGCAEHGENPTQKRFSQKHPIRAGNI
jgi:hypothetical protein